MNDPNATGSAPVWAPCARTPELRERVLLTTEMPPGSTVA